MEYKMELQPLLSNHNPQLQTAMWFCVVSQNKVIVLFF